LYLFIETSSGQAYLPLIEGRGGQEKFRGRQRRPDLNGEIAMTQFNHIPEQSSRFNQFVVSALMGTMIVLAGLLSFAPYSLI
jgi:hypothetical protein